MRKLSGLALRGLAVALPFALTIYFVYWSVTRIEWLVEEALRVVGLGAFYLPGVGIVIFFGALLLLGLVARLLVFQSFLAVLERLLESVPLIKSVYSAIRDFMDFLSGRNRASGKVVSIEIAGAKMLGIVSDTDITPAFREVAGDDEVVGVFLPMSYQLGGYTLYVPRSRLTDVDMDAESAMRYIMTAGIGRAGGPPRSLDGSSGRGDAADDTGN